MTTFGLAEMEALGLLEKKHKTSVRVTNTITNHPDMLTDKELEDVTAVFRSLETGLREATIEIRRGMKMLGLNPSDQELLDIPNTISKNGLIYYPDFCQLCLEYFRQEPDEEEEFRRNMFKVLCGTDPHPTDHRAKKYRVEKHNFSKSDFVQLMKNLPIEVSEDDIEDMFAAVDKNKDDKISYREFQKMINPPDIPQAAKPYVSQLGLKPQLFSPPSGNSSSSSVGAPPPPTPGSISVQSSSYIETETNMSKY